MIPYIINAGLIIAGCLAFYKLLLQRETFYRLNRGILIACLLAAFALPLLRVPQQWSFRKAETVSLHHFQPAQQAQQPPAVTTPGQRVEPQPIRQENTGIVGTGITFGQVMTWLVYLYWFGVMVFGFNFLMQVGILLYRAYTRPVIRDGQFRIVEMSGDKAPCSFGNNIFINPEKYDWDTYNQILLHEKVHIRQGHSLDLLLAELVLIFQWFNPFAWIYRKELENNLEFLTDDQLVHKEEVEKASYQLSLLKVSSPHFPLSLTTNYNQSLLKKRIVMMNAKKSNVHTAWKYFFLLPLLVLFTALLNEPAANAQNQNNAAKNNNRNKPGDIGTEGYWFATIKGETVTINFKRDENNDRNSFHGSTFSLSEFPELPKTQSGTFSLKREAGAMQFTGRFEGNEGMGRYKFLKDEQYAAYMSSQGLGALSDQDLMTFFFVDVKKDYPQLLKSEGFNGVGKNDIVPLAALKVDKAYIQSMRKHYKELVPHNLVTLKALDISESYINEIWDAGYKDISVDDLVAFKSQGIDKNYLIRVRKPRVKEGKEADGEEMSASDVIALKALSIDESYINSFRETGLTNISNQEIVAMKSLGITPDYVKKFQQMGYVNISADDVIATKGLNITPEYIKSFEPLGYKNIPMSDLHSMKGLNITPDYIRSWEAAGYKNISLTQLSGLKSLNVTPDYIKAMKDKGFNYSNLDKYIQLKSIDEDKH